MNDQTLQAIEESIAAYRALDPNTAKRERIALVIDIAAAARDAFVDARDKRNLLVAKRHAAEKRLTAARELYNRARTLAADVNAGDGAILIEELAHDRNLTTDFGRWIGEEE